MYQSFNETNIMIVCSNARRHFSPSEGDDKWLTRVKREPYLLHVKDTLVDFEKE